MLRLAARFTSLVGVGVIALGLGGSAVAANPDQPGGRACMSDEQLKAFMIDVLLQSIAAQRTVCVERAPEISKDVQAAYDGFAQRAQALSDKTMSDVIATFRPEYGDEAPSVRAAALDAAVSESVGHMKETWNAENCGYFIQNLTAVGSEISGLDAGPTINSLIDSGFGTERAIVPRCAN